MLTRELGHRAKNQIALRQSILSLQGSSTRLEPELSSLLPFLASLMGMVEAERHSFGSLFGGRPIRLQDLLESVEASVTGFLEGRERPIRYELGDLALGPSATRQLCLLFGPLLAEILQCSPPEKTIPLIVLRTPGGGELRLGAPCPAALRKGSVAAVLAEGFGARLEAGEDGSVRVVFPWAVSSWTWDAPSYGPIPPIEGQGLDSLVLALRGEEGQRAKLVETLTRSGVGMVFPPSTEEILKAYVDWPNRFGMNQAGLADLVKYREALVADQALLKRLCASALAGLDSEKARDAVRTAHCRQTAFLEAGICLMDRLLHPWASPDLGARMGALAREVLSIWNSEARLDYAATLQGDFDPWYEQILLFALTELVSNSARHAYPEGRAGEIRVSLREVEGDLELVVADDGPGIAPGALPGPYGPGHEPPGDFSGLSLVQTILSGARGRLAFGSAPGTMATLGFPKRMD